MIISTRLAPTIQCRLLHRLLSCRELHLILTHRKWRQADFIFNLGLGEQEEEILRLIKSGAFAIF